MKIIIGKKQLYLPSCISHFMEHLFNYVRSKKRFAIFALFILLALFVYNTFFDILIPNIQNDSYRIVLGPLFILPIIILALGQTCLGGIIFHLFAKASGKTGDFLIAFIIGAVMTLWFSLTYAIFPKYGPFSSIVFVYGEAPWYALPVELAWTTTAILMGTYLAHRFLALGYRRSLLASTTVYTIMTLAAS
jgi:hypothetical protein